MMEIITIGEIDDGLQAAGFKLKHYRNPCLTSGMAFSAGTNGTS